MPEQCPRCSGSGQIPTYDEIGIAKMGAATWAIVREGWDAISTTGAPFILKNGMKVYLVSYVQIRAPIGVERNDRYAWAIATFLRAGGRTFTEGVREVLRG